MSTELQIGDFVVRIIPNGFLQIDNPNTAEIQTHSPGYFLKAAQKLHNKELSPELKSKSNNPLLNGKTFVFVNREIKTADYVVAAAQTRIGYGFLRYVTRLTNSDYFSDDGKISSAGSDKCFLRNYRVIEFTEPVCPWR